MEDSLIGKTVFTNFELRPKCEIHRNKAHLYCQDCDLYFVRNLLIMMSVL